MHYGNLHFYGKWINYTKLTSENNFPRNIIHTIFTVSCVFRGKNSIQVVLVLFQVQHFVLILNFLTLRFAQMKTSIWIQANFHFQIFTCFEDFKFLLVNWTVQSGNLPFWKLGNIFWRTKKFLQHITAENISCSRKWTSWKIWEFYQIF